MLPAGVSFDPTEPVGLLVELIAAWEPDGPTPGVEVAESIRMELVCRPAGLALVGPVLLTGRCAWPPRTASLTRREVAAATDSGSHTDQMARWQELARAEPVPIRRLI